MAVFALNVKAGEHGHEHHAHASPPASGEVAKDSLYQLEAKWQNPAAQTVQLKSFAGTPVILTMAYTRCKFSCPMIVAKLKEIEADLKAKGVKDYRIVMASFDTVHDRPAELKAYMAKKKMDSKHWTLLSTSSEAAVRELAAALGITYSRDKSGEYAHSNSIVLLDPMGVPKVHLNGLQSDHSEIVKWYER